MELPVGYKKLWTGHCGGVGPLQKEKEGKLA
jgi:hypothetical protein